MAQLADTAHSSWPMLGWVAVPAVVIWLLRSPRFLARWPLTHFRAVYLQLACTPVAVYLLLWCWLSNVASNGEAAPLPYLPLLNPLELGQWLILVALVAWWRALPDEASLKFSPSAVAKLTAVTGLALLTGTVLRSCHHFDGVPWDFGALFASRLAQAAVSITWAVAGVLAMLTGNRRHWRAVWFAGAALLGVVVVKLFVIELAEHGGLYRIVSFIGVGVLLLVVGYFAPVPVKREDAAPDREAM
jgi:uncharacterized membrane protein